MSLTRKTININFNYKFCNKLVARSHRVKILESC
jgi:hypothetical protein